MTDFTTYLKDALVNGTLRATNYTAPTTVYLALFTADPTDAGTQTAEVDDHANYTSGYARQAAAFDAPSAGVTQNTDVETFGPVVTTGDVIATHIGVMDAATAGNMLYHDSLTASKTIQNGDSLEVAAGEVSVTLA